MIHSAYLYPAVAPVGYYDVSIDVHRHSCGGVELAIAFTIGAKFQQEFSFCVEHLQYGFREATAEREHFFKKKKNATSTYSHNRKLISRPGLTVVCIRPGLQSDKCSEIHLNK